MRVLIAENKADLAQLWQRHLVRMGLETLIARTSDEALERMVTQTFRVVVINLLLPSGGALGIADYARVKMPEAKVVFVTDQTFFRDGSLFGLVPNLRMTIKSDTPPEDVAAIVHHYSHVA